MINANNPLGVQDDNCSSSGLQTEPTVSTTDSPGGCCVESVNGKVGVVVLGTDDIEEGATNFYYTDERARAALSADLPIEFDVNTGRISHWVVDTISPGTYGSDTTYPVITVNDTGHIIGINEKEFPEKGTAWLTDDLKVIEELTSVGILVRTGVNTWSLRGITGTSGRIVITNPNGTAGNPTLDLATAGTAGTYGTATQVPRITTDAFGRVTGVTLVTIAPGTPTYTGPETIGNLTNVSEFADAPASAGDVLTWTGTEWASTPQHIQGRLTSVISAIAPYKVMLDSASLPVNQISRTEDVLGNKAIQVQTILYVKASDPSGGVFPTNIIIDELIGQLPVDFRPSQDIVLPCAAIFSATKYRDAADTAFFLSNQAIGTCSVLINTEGELKLNAYADSGTYSLPTFSGDEHLIIQIVGSFLYNAPAL